MRQMHCLLFKGQQRQAAAAPKWTPRAYRCCCRAITVKLIDEIKTRPPAESAEVISISVRPASTRSLAGNGVAELSSRMSFGACQLVRSGVICAHDRGESH